jgi:hypothetical protein
MTKRIIVIKKAKSAPSAGLSDQDATGAPDNTAAPRQIAEEVAAPPRLEPASVGPFQLLTSRRRPLVLSAMAAGAAACLVAVAWLLKPATPDDRRTATLLNAPPLAGSVPSLLPSSPLDVPGSLGPPSLPETKAAVNPAPPAEHRSPSAPARKTARLVRPKYPDAFRGTVIVREQVLATAKKPLSGQSFHWEAPAVPPLAHASALESFYGMTSLRHETPYTLMIPNLSRHAASRIVPPMEIDLSSPASDDWPMQPVSTDAVRPLGLRYTMGGSGERRVRSPLLTVEANQDAYLYVWTRASSGDWQRVSPPEHAEDNAARVEKGKRYMLSAKEPLPFGFEPHDLPVLIVLSRLPRPGSDAPPVPNQAGTEPPASVIAQDHQLLREEAEEPTAHGTYEKAVYIVETAPHPESHLAITTR